MVKVEFIQLPLFRTDEDRYPIKSDPDGAWRSLKGRITAGE